VTPNKTSSMSTRVITQTSVCHFFTHLFMLAYPTIAVMQAEAWGVNVASLLPLAFPGFILYGLGSIPMGLWVDRAGGWRPMILGMLGMGAGAMVCSQATVNSLWILTIGLGIMGLSASAYHPAGMSLITRTIKRSAWGLGINGSFGSAAIALAPITAELLCEHWGWQQTFVLLAIPAVSLGIACSFFPISHTHELRGPPPPAPTATDIRNLFTTPFVLLCVAMALGGLVYRGNTLVFPTLFDHRVSSMSHGAATSIAYGMGALMNIAGGYLAERFAFERVYLTLHLCGLPFLVATAWLTETPLLVVAAVYAACAIGMQPAENSLVAQLTPPSRRGIAFGIKFTMVFGVGALAVPLVSTLLSWKGLTAVQLSLSGSVVMLVGVVTWLCIRLSRTNTGPPGAVANRSIVSTNARSDTGLDK
jgi:FSR family fosmidomycin resistance protein-like MFS transporter